MYMYAHVPWQQHSIDTVKPWQDSDILEPVNIKIYSTVLLLDAVLVPLSFALSDDCSRLHACCWLPSQVLLTFLYLCFLLLSFLPCLLLSLSHVQADVCIAQ